MILIYSKKSLFKEFLSTQYLSHSLWVFPTIPPISGCERGHLKDTIQPDLFCPRQGKVHPNYALLPQYQGEFQ
jgi:hypothetical protein